MPPGVAFLARVDAVIDQVLAEASRAGLSTQEVVNRLKFGEPIDCIFPGIGDPFPGHTTAYLVWELQAAIGGRRG